MSLFTVSQLVHQLSELIWSPKDEWYMLWLCVTCSTSLMEHSWPPKWPGLNPMENPVWLFRTAGEIKTGTLSCSQIAQWNSQLKLTGTLSRHWWNLYLTGLEIVNKRWERNDTCDYFGVSPNDKFRTCGLANPVIEPQLKYHSVASCSLNKSHTGNKRKPALLGGNSPHDTALLVSWHILVCNHSFVVSVRNFGSTVHLTDSCLLTQHIEFYLTQVSSHVTHSWSYIDLSCPIRKHYLVLLWPKSQ